MLVGGNMKTFRTSLENWSFDGLFGRFPGADGIANATANDLVNGLEF